MRCRCGCRGRRLECAYARSKESAAAWKGAPPPPRCRAKNGKPLLRQIGRRVAGRMRGAWQTWLGRHFTRAMEAEKAVQREGRRTSAAARGKREEVSESWRDFRPSASACRADDAAMDLAYWG